MFKISGGILVTGVTPNARLDDALGAHPGEGALQGFAAFLSLYIYRFRLKFFEDITPKDST